MRSAISLLSGFFVLGGSVLYIIAIIRKQIAPVTASWLIWALVDSLILAGMIAAGAVNAQIATAVFAVWIIVLVSFKYGKSGWAKLDFVALGGAVTGIFLWKWYNSPTLAIVLSNGIVCVGCIPTFVSAYKNPLNESKWVWLIYWCSSILSTSTIPHWDFNNATQPLTFLGTQTIALWLLWVRPKLSKTPN